jgi:hypothetical protein
MEIVKAFELLKTITKPSTSLDAFTHMDMSLVPAKDLAEFELALKIIYKQIIEGNLTKEEASKRILT